jgi:DNA-directed RNA polymerase specialized sigma24 family protein
VSSPNDITGWIGQLKGGDSAAAAKLWDAYFRRLVGLARKKLQTASRRVADEEDVALSAFASLCRGAREGRFPLLQDRDNLWHLLVILTARKAADLRRHQGRQKRGGGAVPVGSAADDSGPGTLEQVIGREPTPEFAAQVADECRRLLGLLWDDELRQVALWKMEGYTNEEITERLGCVPRTIERRLRLIRRFWEEEGASA